MVLTGGSHGLQDADRIRGLGQLREQGFSKRQMVLDGSQGEVSRVGRRSLSSPGQGRGKSVRSGEEEEDFQPARFRAGAGGRAGGPDPSPAPTHAGCQRGQPTVTLRASHSRCGSSPALAPCVPLGSIL